MGTVNAMMEFTSNATLSIRSALSFHTSRHLLKMRRLAKDNEEITLSVRMNGNQNYNKDHTCVDDEDDSYCNSARESNIKLYNSEYKPLFDNKLNLMMTSIVRFNLLM